jgi:hypothetical protein
MRTQLKTVAIAAALTAGLLTVPTLSAQAEPAAGPSKPAQGAPNMMGGAAGNMMGGSNGMKGMMDMMVQMDRMAKLCNGMMTRMAANLGPSPQPQPKPSAQPAPK